MGFLATLPLATLSSAARLSTIGFCTVQRNRTFSQLVKRVCMCGNETRAMMEHPSPSDFVIDVTDTHVIVTFNPSGRPYTFGRLVDPEDIAQYGPLSRGPETSGEAGNNAGYPEDEVVRMAHTLAVKAVTTT
jgi:hypothetical protein